MIAQIIITLIMLGRLGFDFIDHGKPLSRTVNFWTRLLVTMFCLSLLYLGGFYRWVF